MAGVYSDVDFNRMQEQLLELREASYRSEEKCRGQEKELINLKESVSSLEKELFKASQIINRSKRAKDYELAVNEIESLQRKLHSHEDDWRLQNETLMKELAQLVRTNEHLEKELKEKKDKDDGDHKGMVDAEEHQAVLHELRRLQAQYSALLKCSRDKTEKSSTSFSVDQKHCSNNSNNSDGKADGEITTETTEDIPSEQNLEDLRLRLETEKEENSLLKKQLNLFELKYKEGTNSMRLEINQASEKLKKKQESILQLQEAKDKLFTEMSSKLESVQREQDMLLIESKEKFHQERLSWNEIKKNLEDTILRLKTKYTEIHNDKKRLEEQLISRSEESSQSLKELQLGFELKIKKQAEVINTLKEKVDNLKLHLKESQTSHQLSTEENVVLRSEKETQALKLVEVTKVADKRKGLLDQQAMKYQEDSDKHRDQIKDIKKNHDLQLNDLNLELSQLKMQLKELKMIEDDCEILKEKIKNVENTRNLLEQSLKEADYEIKSNKDEYDFKISELKSSYNLQIVQIQNEHSEKIKEFEGRLLSKESEIKELSDAVRRYEQMIKDHEEDKKLHEKKGSTVIKDLKRQLHFERKRGEKLQEKLQEILSESKNRQLVEDLFRPLDDRLKLTDTSSLSSWSPSGLSRDNLTSQCSLQNTDEESSSDSTMRQENDSLVRRIGELLFKVSTLEEKVSHLESSNASMAEDLLQKTAVIDHYNMDSRTGQSSSHDINNKMSLKRVMDFVTDKNEDRKNDMNKKLQRMLEEMLTKNMHLQNDLEKLSQELSDVKGSQTS